MTLMSLTLNILFRKKYYKKKHDFNPKRIKYFCKQKYDFNIENIKCFFKTCF